VSHVSGCIFAAEWHPLPSVLITCALSASALKAWDVNSSNWLNVAKLLSAHVFALTRYTFQVIRSRQSRAGCRHVSLYWHAVQISSFSLLSLVSRRWCSALRSWSCLAQAWQMSGTRLVPCWVCSWALHKVCEWNWETACGVAQKLHDSLSWRLKEHCARCAGRGDLVHKLQLMQAWC